MNPNKSNGFIAFNLFIFYVSLFLLTSSGNIVFDSDQSLSRYETTRAIVERFDLSVPAGIGIRGVDGREYSWYGIGQPLLAAPFYIVGKSLGSPQMAVSLMNPLFGAATAVLIYLFSISLGYSRRASLFTAIFYGIGTMAWPLSKQPFDHIVETFFVLLSFYCMYLYTADERTSNLLFSSLYFGIAFTVRYVSLLIVPPLFTMLIIHYLKRSDLKTAASSVARDILLFSTVFLPFAGLSLWYNHYRFSSPFETGFSLMASRAGLDFFGGTPLLTGIKGFLISPAKGFFFYSPVALLFFFSIRSFLKRHLGVAVCFIFTITSYLLFLSKNIFWHGDWAWGPRYLLAITPFLILPIAGLLDSAIWVEKKLIRATIWILFLVSFVIQLAAISVFFQKYFVYLRYEEKTKFIVVQKEGVPITVEPPNEVYFDWHRSPIVEQFRFIYKTAREIKDRNHSVPPEVLTPSEMKADPNLRVFDFWWLYQYVLWRDYFGFIVALILSCSAIFAGIRISRAVRGAP